MKQDFVLGKIAVLMVILGKNTIDIKTLYLSLDLSKNAKVRK